MDSNENDFFDILSFLYITKRRMLYFLSSIKILSTVNFEYFQEIMFVFYYQIISISIIIEKEQNDTAAKEN
jgi:hypothetical protein